MRPEIEEIVDYLNGSCNTLDEACQFILGDEFDAMSLSKEEMEYIDERIFKCYDCDWWFESHEESEEEPGCCIDCAGDV